MNETSSTQSASRRTVLDPAASHVTIINTYDVPLGRADELLTFLAHATNETLRHVPGFISANLHVSTDGLRVVNYAQWRNTEDLLAAGKMASVQECIRGAASIATAFKPVPFVLRETIGAAGTGANP